MSDIVERLRDADTTRRIGESYADTHERRQRDRNEAAAEIERLRAVMKTAIRQFEDGNRLECHRTLCTVLYGKQH
jgi:hypothetical protein